MKVLATCDVGEIDFCCRAGLPPNRRETWRSGAEPPEPYLPHLHLTVASSQGETMLKTCLHLQRATLQFLPCNRKAEFSDSVYYHIISYRHFSCICASTTNQRQQSTRYHPQLATYISPHKIRLTQHTYNHLYKLDIRNMSSDADYASFLDKANQDTGSVEAKDTTKKSYGTRSVNTSVPKVLEQVEEYYVSDADEPFEPVAFKFSGSSVSAGMRLSHLK